MRAIASAVLAVLLSACGGSPADDANAPITACWGPPWNECADWVSGTQADIQTSCDTRYGTPAVTGAEYLRGQACRTADRVGSCNIKGGIGEINLRYYSLGSVPYTVGTARDNCTGRGTFTSG